MRSFAEISLNFGVGPLQPRSAIATLDFTEGYPQRGIRVLVIMLYPNWNRCRSQARGKFFLPRDAMQSAVYAIRKSSVTPSVTLTYVEVL